MGINEAIENLAEFYNMPDDEQIETLDFCEDFLGKKVKQYKEIVTGWVDEAERKAKNAADNENYTVALEQSQYASGLSMALVLFDQIAKVKND